MRPSVPSTSFIADITSFAFMGHAYLGLDLTAETVPIVQPLSLLLQESAGWTITCSLRVCGMGYGSAGPSPARVVNTHLQVNTCWYVPNIPQRNRSALITFIASIGRSHALPWWTVTKRPDGLYRATKIPNSTPE